MENRGILNGNSQSAAGIALSQTLSAKSGLKIHLLAVIEESKNRGNLMQNRSKNKTRSQIGRTSRTKGKVGEREVAHLFIDNGFPDAHRSAQCRGNSKDGEADVAGTPGIHVEVKRVEKLNLENAMQQSIRDSELQKDGIPVVIHRKNGAEWLVTMRFSDWVEWYKHEYSEQ